mmetsp:Transcript_108710/g.318042  ORF Transcript_108710/g.318042 Transcript_108710/m.318042 type:complete len:234 (-) Transcript_108710:591-1292(-)
MTVTAERNRSRPTCRTSSPSTSTAPSPASSSNVRKSTRSSVDLPLPVRPTMPRRSPAATSRSTPLSTLGRSGRYRSETPSKVTRPCVGQLGARALSPGSCRGASASVLSIVNATRWKEVKLVSVCATVRTVQFSRPTTESACVTAMAARAAVQEPAEAPAPGAAADRPRSAAARTMPFPSSSMRIENHRSTALAAKLPAVPPSTAASALVALWRPRPSCRIVTTPAAAAACSA